MRHCHAHVVEEVLNSLTNERSRQEAELCVREGNQVRLTDQWERHDIPQKHQTKPSMFACVWRPLQKGETPLHLAAELRSDEPDEDTCIVKILMEHHADVTAVTRQVCFVCNLYTKLTSTLVLWMCCFFRAERRLFITAPGWETPLFFRRCSVTYPPTSSRPPSTNTPRYKSAVNVRSASRLRKISDWSDASVKVRSHQTRMTRIARLIYMLSQCKDAIDNPAALFARMRRREWCELSVFFTRDSHELKNLNFGGYSRRVNQSGACSSSDVITSGGRKSQTTMEDKVIVVVCGYPELYMPLRTFTKTGIHFASRLDLPGRSPSHDAYSRLLCSEFHARMAWISHEWSE